MPKHQLYPSTKFRSYFYRICKARRDHFTPNDFEVFKKLLILDAWSKYYGLPDFDIDDLTDESIYIQIDRIRNRG